MYYKGKKLLSLALTLVMTLALCVGIIPAAAAAWDGSAATGFDGGSGTRNDPYIISTAGQLALFRDLVNDGGKSNICAKVVADIDLNRVAWEPVGLNSTGYTGVFDGGGWSIQNVYIDSISNTLKVYQTNSSKEYQIQVAGLFGVVGSGGMVKNVNISGNVSGDIYSRNSTGVYIGGLVGTNFGTVEECFSTCAISNLSINNDDYIGIGGLVGNAYSGAVIRNCYNVGAVSADIYVTDTSYRNYIGGMVGLADCQLYNCYSAAPISISTNSYNLRLGGFVGNAGGNQLDNCYFDRNVCTAASYVAGCDFSSSSAYNPAGCAPKSTSEMKTTEFVTTLGNAFAYDYENVNDGYPVLAVMTYGEQEDWSQWFDDEVNGTVIDQEVFDLLLPTELYSKDLTKSITRVEFAAVAVKLYEEMGGEKLDAAELENPFADTTSDAVIKAYAIGLTNGVSDTEFRPYDLLSRQDLATMLTRVYKALYLSGWTLETDGNYTLDISGVAKFADDDFISGYAKPSVYFMVKNEIIKGMTATLFAPKNTTSAEAAIGYADASREQAVIMAVRMYNNL
jgi:hypothetical protein